MLGKTISNQYRILMEVSQDSLNALYKGFDLREDKPVFITFLTEKALSRPLEILLRFRRSAEAASKLNHPNLLKILSIAESDKQTYIVQEYLDLQTLSQLLNQPQNIDQPFPIDTAVTIILQISEALDLCHQNNLLHQALQPDNILVSPDLTTARLFNFGLSILRDLSRITETEEIISTFGYLSPESSGILRKPIDSRSDIYSVGILFYQLLTGKLPYPATDVSTLIHQHIATQPASPSTLNNLILPVIENICLRLISKEPSERYQSLSGLIEDLKEYRKQKNEGKEKIDFEIARFDKLKELSFSTRLIGRDREIVQLQELFIQAKQEQGSLCFVFGEPGIGKSRLIDELRSSVHSLGGFFVGGKCYQYEFRAPYKVFSEAVDAYIEKVKRLTQSEQVFHIKRIKEALGELGGEVVKIAPSITDLIGIPPKLVELGPEKEKIRFLITVTNFLSVLSSQSSPLLIFLDDLQWIDDGSLEILERFAKKLQNTSTLLIISYRDTEVEQSHPLSQLILRLKGQSSQLPAPSSQLPEIPLKSFTLAETSQMIGQILMEKEEEVSLLSSNLYERAKGNPFFTLELLHSLVDSKIICLKEDRYTYEPEKLKQVVLPATIIEAILRRMKDLTEEDLKVISYASVMGKEIDFKLLTDLVQKPADQILNCIENGIKNQLLYRDLTGRESIFFMHDRIRRAFYERVSEEERIPLHKHIAEVLEEENKNDPDSVLYDLAYHFARGKIENKALEYSIPAAHKAKFLCANILAVDLYNTAKDILERQNKKESKEYIEVLENLGEVYRLAGKFDESIDSLKMCESLIPQQNKFHKAQVLSKMGDTLFEKGEIENSAKVLEEALKVLNVLFFTSKLGIILGILKEFSRQMLHTWFPGVFVSRVYKASERELIIVRLLNRLAHIYYFSDMSNAFYFHLKALNLSEKIGPCSELIYTYIDGGPVWATFPWFSKAFRDLGKGLKMAQDTGDRIKEGSAYAYLVVVSYLANKPKQGIESANKAISILRELGEYWDLGVAYVWKDICSCFCGRLKEAVKENEENFLVLKEADALQPLGWSLFIRGAIFSLNGGVSEAIIQGVKESNRLMIETKDKADMLFSLIVLAFAYLRKAEYNQAITVIEDALRLFPTHHNKCPWCFEIFIIGAQIYLSAIVDNPDLPQDKKKIYLNRAKWFCFKSRQWTFFYKFFFAWSLQVNGTYLWLTGHKKRAVRTWNKGLKWLRTNKNNPGGDKYRLAYTLLEEARFLLTDDPGSKKAHSNLIEARDLFIEMDCKLDLETCNLFLESLSPQGVILDSRTVLTQKRHLDSLLSVTQAIGSVFVLDELLQKILEYGLKVTGAERGFLLLYDDKDRFLKLKVSHGLEKDLQELSFSYENYRISLELINEVNRSKTACIADLQTVPNSRVQAELKNFQVRQAIAVPLHTRDKSLGILYLDNRLAGGMFGKDELELMKSFAVQASISIENAYLVSKLVEQERLRQELVLGRQIQNALLPKESPDTPGLSLSGFTLPAKEIGGDYYDFIDLPNQNLAIVIGDVSGKGVAAGLLMAMAKTAIHAFSQGEVSPMQVLMRTNNILQKHTSEHKFMTMLYLKWDAVAKKFTYSSAGHEHILIYHKDKDQVESIVSGGFMLGMLEDIESYLEEHSITLNPKDKLLLYTDGVTEAKSPKGERFGLDRLISVFKQNSSKTPQELILSIKDQVYFFMDTQPQYDDITLVGIEAV